MDCSFPFGNHLFDIIFTEALLFCKVVLFLLHFVLWFCLIISSPVFSADFPQVSLDLTVIHQSNFLWIHPPQELTGGSPLVLIWWDDLTATFPQLIHMEEREPSNWFPFSFPDAITPCLWYDLIWHMPQNVKRSQCLFLWKLKQAVSDFWCCFSFRKITQRVVDFLLLA